MHEALIKLPIRKAINSKNTWKKVKRAWPGDNQEVLRNNDWGSSKKRWCNQRSTVYLNFETILGTNLLIPYSIHWACFLSLDPSIWPMWKMWRWKASRRTASHPPAMYSWAPKTTPLTRASVCQLETVSAPGCLKSAFVVKVRAWPRVPS